MGALFSRHSVYCVRVRVDPPCPSSSTIRNCRAPHPAPTLHSRVNLILRSQVTFHDSSRGPVHSRFGLWLFVPRASWWLTLSISFHISEAHACDAPEYECVCACVRACVRVCMA